MGGYDLLNEPAVPKDGPPEALSTLYGALIRAIRAVDRVHMLVVEGDSYAHDFATLQSLPDDNVLYEFHEYAIFNRQWKSPNGAAPEPLLQLRELTHKPLWLGEFGEESDDWQRQMVQLMKANEIGWAFWPWKRIDLGNGHPVIETIRMPDSWDTTVGRWSFG